MVFIISFMTSGCWNYKEVGDLWMVAGAAIDWDSKENKYVLTAEIVKPTGGKEAQMISTIVSTKSDTLFDAVRKNISSTGRKLYWAHTSVLIISDSVARIGLIPIIDCINRGGEFRSNIWFAVSRQSTAKEILETKTKLQDSVSMHIADIFKGQKQSSNFLQSEMWFFQKDLADEGISPVLSTIRIVNSDGEFIPQLYGAAVFKKDKLVGYIDETDTKSLLFIKDEVKGGDIVVKNVGNTKMKVTLEILKNETTLTPQIQGGNITMNVMVKTNVGITEIHGSENILTADGLTLLKAEGNKIIREQIERTIDKIQKDYDSDVFGFGKKTQKKMPATWKKLEPNWDDTFRNINTNINVDIHVINSAGSYKPVTVGD